MIKITFDHFAKYFRMVANTLILTFYHPKGPTDVQLFVQRKVSWIHVKEVETFFIPFRNLQMFTSNGLTSGKTCFSVQEFDDHGSGL